MSEEKNVQTENQEAPSSCSSNCSACQETCSSRESAPAQEKAPLHKLSTVQKVIAVVSGKGGVGKSLVTSMMAVAMTRKGYNAAILDADMTGPSIPTVFGVMDGAKAVGMGLAPAHTKTGIEFMSLNLLLEDKEDPVVWRGSIINGMIKQFWTDVIWSQRDYMFVDLPPGTGDIPISVYQVLPVDGIIIVASPQELVSMIVSKGVKMAQLMNVPILGIVENMSYLECPGCGEKIHMFGESHVEDVAKKYDLKVLGKIPLNPSIAALCDAGKIEDFEGDWIDSAADYLEKTLPVTKKRFV